VIAAGGAAARGEEDAMSLYLLLIYDDERPWDSAPPEDGAKVMRAYYDFTEEADSAGVVRHSAALQPSATATTVRVRNGDRLLTDGPFAETKEQLGGYYLVDCATLDEAIEWASRIPGASTGAIEVRPVMQIPPRDQYETDLAAAAGRE
jgi:hypothetical protein